MALRAALSTSIRNSGRDVLLHRGFAGFSRTHSGGRLLAIKGYPAAISLAASHFGSVLAQVPVVKATRWPVTLPLFRISPLRRIQDPGHMQFRFQNTERDIYPIYGTLWAGDGLS